MRLLSATIVAASAIVGAMRVANADPCAVALRTIHVVAQTHEYAVTFSSFVERSADLRITLYAGDTAFAADVPDVRFERAETNSTARTWPWHSSAAYVRLSDDADAPTAAMVEVLDPSSKMPIACDGDHKQIDPTTGDIFFDQLSRRRGDPSQRDDEREVAAMPAAAATAVPIDARGMPASGFACNVPFAAARTDRIVQALFPASARAAGETGTTLVRIELTRTGAVTAATISRSSGYGDLNAAARDAAATTTYAPERFRCEPVGGLYLFSVTFTRSR